MTSIDQQALKRPAQEARQRGRSGSGWYAWLARAGLVAKGVSVRDRRSAGGQARGRGRRRATSRSGALHALAQESFGRIVLILLVIGFAAYALWRGVQAFALPGRRRKDWLKRLGYLGRAAIYVGLTFSAVSILLGDGGGSSQDAKAHKTTGSCSRGPPAPGSSASAARS